MSEWQPIGTAPKTGERLILGQESGPYILLYAGSEPLVGFWNGRSWDDGDFNSFIEGVTHWMPLPSPPKQDGGTA